MLFAVEKLLGQRFDREQSCEVHQHTFQLYPPFQQETDARSSAIALSQSLLEMRIQPLESVLAFLRITRRENEVQCLRLRSCCEELVD